MGYALRTPSGHIHDYPYWRRAKIVYSRIDGSWRKVMVRGDFERAVRDRACDFTRVRWVRYSGVGSVGGVSEFSIEPVRHTIRRRLQNGSAPQELPARPPYPDHPCGVAHLGPGPPVSPSDRTWRPVPGYASGVPSELRMPQTPTVVHCDPEILGGTPVFVGTRVPVDILFEYLEAGDSLDVFLDQFPSVSRDQAVATIELGRSAVVAGACAA